MGRSLKKGPYVDVKLFAKVNKQIQTGMREPDKDLGAQMHDNPGVCGLHFYGSQRQDFQQGLRDRGHGRAQAGRIFTDENIQGTFNEKGGRSTDAGIKVISKLC